MNGPRIGSLFSGYGGLDTGVMAALGGSVAWHVEFDKAPSKILAHHWPAVPNYGDVTTVDWSTVEPVDIITGGSPCQDLSHAGKRQGMTEGTRSNLWVAMREAIAQLRPGMVVWENVRGAYSACADSEMGSCPRCVGEDPAGRHAPNLRALGRVLGDLSDLGYDCRWHGLRAADVGAPHGRFRVFVTAHSGSERHGSRQDRRSMGRVDGENEGSSRQWERARPLVGDRTDTIPSPHAVSAGLQGLPVGAGDTWSAAAGSDQGTLDWRAYSDAIRRWERVLGRLAPPPALGDRESPLFVEWMMGLPAGHVTDVPGLSRNDMLKALGNGVVPQQAAAALRFLLGAQEAAA